MRKLLNLMGLILILTPSMAMAQASLTTGADFLLQTTGARPDAMGQAFSAVADDVNTLSFNPAGLAVIKLPEFGYSYDLFVSSISYNFFGAAIPTGDLGVFGLSYINDGVAPFDSTNGVAPAVSAGDSALGISWGKSFDSLDTGLTFKYINRTVDTLNATDWAVDLGLKWRITPQWAVAASLLNWGPSISFPNPEQLPTVIDLGTALKVIDSPMNTLTLAVDANNNLTTQVQRFGFGAEYWLQQAYALRAGYLANSTEEGFSVGAGLKLPVIELDYAFQPYSNLGSVHRFSGILRWDGPWMDNKKADDKPLAGTKAQDNARESQIAPADSSDAGKSQDKSTVEPPKPSDDDSDTQTAPANTAAKVKQDKASDTQTNQDPLANLSAKDNP